MVFNKVKQEVEYIIQLKIKMNLPDFLLPKV